MKGSDGALHKSTRALRNLQQIENDLEGIMKSLKESEGTFRPISETEKVLEINMSDKILEF